MELYLQGVRAPGRYYIDADGSGRYPAFKTMCPVETGPNVAFQLPDGKSWAINRSKKRKL